MLHIITPLFRLPMINLVSKSIPLFDDIIWHISLTNQNETLLPEDIKQRKNVKIYSLDCDDKDTTAKRNACLNTINDGFFCFLDDDTIFHPNMYEIYQKKNNVNFNGMVIGQQLKNNNTLRLNCSIPINGRIDTGNVLCNTSCLEKIKWPLHAQHGKARDFLFWTAVWNHYGKRAELINTPISYYNKLR